MSIVSIKGDPKFEEGTPVVDTKFMELFHYEHGRDYAIHDRLIEATENQKKALLELDDIDATIDLRDETEL